MKQRKKNKPQPAAKKDVKLDEFKDLDDDYQETNKWYHEDVVPPKNVTPVTDQILIELKEESKKCHDAEVANYNIKNSKTNSNYQWMKTVMSTGTVSDRIAANTVLVQNDPVCNLETIRNMVNMVKVGKKRECFTVMETLTELFLSDLLRPDQKLKPFYSQPLWAINDLSSGNAIKRRKILSLWYFEDQLKEIYTSFVLALNKAAQDTVEANKEKAITAMFKLLCGNPEQEKNLLSYIINKLGDPSQKVASKAIYSLTQLLFKHPNMQEVVLREVERFLFRPNLSNRAQYYSLCFMSQFYLSHEAPQVAKKMIQMYLAFFKGCVGKGDVDSRMMSAILMGINRAYPYAKLEFKDMEVHVNTLYKLVHLASFNISLQVLVLLYHVTGEIMAERFYSALYRKLVDPKLLTSTHQAMLLSLIYKALLKDTQVNRIKMFIKRLLQITLHVQPAFSCGILYLISQLISKKQELHAITLQEIKTTDLNQFDDDDEEKYADIKDEKDDFEIKKEDEEEIQSELGDLNRSKTVPSQNGKITPSETIEIKEDPEESLDLKPDTDLLEISFKGSSWCHMGATSQKKSIKPVVKYNPLARNPLYGGGEFLAYTELCYLEKYFHPTVALFGEQVMCGGRINYTGDPLKDFTLIRFLERFVFKNPKKIDDKIGAHPTFGKRKFYKPKGVKMLSVNSKSYLNEEERNIPVDELFLYSYLQRKYQDRPKKEEDEDSDVESVQSEEFEEMLDKMAGFKDVGSDDEEIDYMEEIDKSVKKNQGKGKKKKKKGNEEEEESEEEAISEEEDGLDDEEDDFGDEDDDDDLEANEEDLDLLDGLSDNEDEDLEFLSEDSEEEHKESSSKKLKKSSKKNKNDVSSLFASADEFASLLEDEGSSKQKPGSSSAMLNKDKASQKQLAWEEKRNHWLKGYNKVVKGKSDGHFSKKRPNQSKFHNKNKKFKK